MPSLDTMPLTERRCAIYTRKSVQPPISQEYTSLEAQREICSAYVASQEHRGWTQLPKIYEDAGRSGGNLDRPALQELLGDIEQGFVDVVLVYKLDRITRTLLDFVRLIDFFERYDVTFVSITQNFDTGDSMGRLIRNILLTFAQFEREIASDRIRDKKLMMKRAGRWTGGNAPLGYDLKKGKLVPNAEESLAVKHIFETYVREPTLSAVHRSLLQHGFRRKKWKAKNGARMGGGPICLTTLAHILRNPVYIGEITRYGEHFEGLHEPIIEKTLWDRVQRTLAIQTEARPRRPEHFLAGIIRDAYGRPMNSRGVERGPGLGRYYASAAKTWAHCEGVKSMRCLASEAEHIVISALQEFLTDRVGLRQLVLSTNTVGRTADVVVARGTAAANRLGSMSAADKGAVLKLVLRQIDLARDRMIIWIRVAALIQFIQWDGIANFRISPADLVRAKRVHRLDIPAHLYRERRVAWLPVEPLTSGVPNPSQPLMRLLDDAREAQRLFYKHRDLSITELAWTLGRKPTSFARLLKLNYLAPDIVASIVDGTQPPHIDRYSLTKCDLPLDWALQRRLLGFPVARGS